MTAGSNSAAAARDQLIAWGRAADEDIDLAAAALALAALAHPETDMAPYRRHLADLRDEAAAEAERRLSGPRLAIDLATRIEIINAVLFDRHGYQGDRETYDDPRNADLMSVIDRRRGLPIALGILYAHVARAQGWLIEGLSFPGHFLLRLRDGAAAAIVDPFNSGHPSDTADLRALLKAAEGDKAELKPRHFQPAGNRQMLMRLQNNIKLRLLRDHKTGEAIAIVERMLLLAPEEPGLWHEAGMLHARLGNMRAAIGALENLVALNSASEWHGTAMRLLAEMRSRLN
jgi:regulator of sirC expression with transglutaminase-like and TPR domain